MPKKIKFKLSVSGLDELSKKIEELEQTMDKVVKESIKEVANETEIKIIEKMTEPRPPYNWNAIDTGELALSTKIETIGNKTIISQEGENAFNVEFGDGRYFGTYPDSSKIPAGVPEHEDSYQYIAKENSTRWNPQGKENKVNFANGQYAVGQMYYGGQYIRETLPKRVQKKGSDALSKI